MRAFAWASYVLSHSIDFSSRPWIQPSDDLQFYAKGHGVPSEMMDKTFGWAKRFFELSFDEKMELFINNQDNYRGYTPMYGSGKPDVDGLASEYYKPCMSVYHAVMVD